MRLKINVILLLLAFGLCGTKLNAQEEVGSFSLEEAVQFAMENSYILKNTSKDIIAGNPGKIWSGF